MFVIRLKRAAVSKIIEKEIFGTKNVPRVFHILIRARKKVQTSFYFEDKSLRIWIPLLFSNTSNYFTDFN